MQSAPIDDRTLIVAELSANHNNKFDLAVKTIEAMAKAGADAVKVQTYKPESLTLDLNTGYFAPRTEGLWKGYTPWNLYQEAAMPYEWQPKLKEVALDIGLLFFSSPFDLEAVDFLAGMDVPMFKIASFEINDLQLIEYAAAKGKPMIISTGVANENDIREAIEACHRMGNNDITLLKCTSEYPSDLNRANLLTIPDMKKRFRVEVGVSDHTLGSTVPQVAVALGAKIVEKHFILDRRLGGPDSAFSMEPNEFAEMVQAIRNVECSLGEVCYKVSEKDINRRRSLFIVQDVKAGDLLNQENVRSIRPGNGLAPKYLPGIIGMRFRASYLKGTPLTWEMINYDHIRQVSDYLDAPK